ncbi:hypothetical protein DFP72DRAFT_1073776 [Ephemerocybe angulata]|uniref:Uncharacterized protein n=1 Tax=Ephemerocybe angulata TaxID=980116 RepID=A0A8H6HNC7_9AGAR|nr:hypothetical protein DFP72DRAFT_1073776 [Tulosesus angulatus]
MPQNSVYSARTSRPTPKTTLNVAERARASTALYIQHHRQKCVDCAVINGTALEAVRLLSLKVRRLGTASTSSHSEHQICGRPIGDLEQGHEEGVGFFEDEYDDNAVVVRYVGSRFLPVLVLSPRWRQRERPSLFTKGLRFSKYIVQEIPSILGAAALFLKRTIQ